jgi:hypothetical protein
MKTETWLPILTLGLGWGLAQVTEVLKDRRASNRERRAREAELQRATLLELQDTLHKLSNLANDALLAFDEPQARLRFWEANAKAQLLVSRVKDQRAQTEAALVINAAEIVVTAEDEEAAEALENLHARYGTAIGRLGELLRERY